MIIASRYILYLIIALIPINCQQSKKGIHELQSLYYKERNAPLLEKITVLNGIDVLLEKKLTFQRLSAFMAVQESQQQRCYLM